MIHVVSYSGGIGSWQTAKMVIDKYGKKNIFLVFADVLIEDPSLYSFLAQTVNKFGCRFIHLKDGRNPWDVFRSARYMGNTRTAHCSEELKSKPFYRWIDDLCKKEPDEEIRIYLGIDYTEINRLERLKKKRPKYNFYSPLIEQNISKTEMFSNLKKEGITLPTLYAMGFAHNNCGGGCVKAGQAQWKALFKYMPERYMFFEKQQEQLFSYIPTMRPFLRMTINGAINYLSLKQFRILLEKDKQIDIFDIGGCGCFFD